MRTAYHEQLSELDRQMGDMCGLAGAAMRQATQALLDTDLAIAEQVIGDHEQLVAKRAQAEKDAIALLALQQPVAGDLREIVSSIQIMADAERMGALAVHVAKIARRRHPHHTLPEDVRGYFAEMGAVAVTMGESARQVLVASDPQKAARLRDEDDAMDNLHRQLLTVLLDHAWNHGVAAAVDAALLGRFYERFADHAVEVGRRVVFRVTGALPPEEEVSTY
jgi:phosphate transport system protein